MKRSFFETNSQKASERVTINSFMMGVVIVMITLVWSLDPKRFNIYVLGQLILAVPLIFVSSLAYAKIGYWRQAKMWDIFGWFTHNTGAIFILNSIGLMAATAQKSLAVLYFVLIIVLMSIYSVINVIYKPETFKEKLFKFLFFLFILTLGGILPLMLNKFF